MGKASRGFTLMRSILIWLPLPIAEALFSIMKMTGLVPGGFQYSAKYTRPNCDGFQAEETHRYDNDHFHLASDAGQWVSDFVHRSVKLPVWTLHTLPATRDFPVEEGDVWVATFPKAGTTWMQHIVYLIMTKDFDNKKQQEERFPQIDFSSSLLIDPPKHVAAIAARPSPRMIKTHLPHQLLPTKIGKGKLIYVARNPKDNIVSWYHFSHRIEAYQYTGPLDHMIDSVLTDNVYMGPMPEHVTEYWDCRNDDNFLFVFFEDLVVDHRGGVQKVAKFLDKELSEDELSRIVAETSFSSMQKNPATDWKWQEKLGGFKAGSSGTDQGFFRKGQVGSWRDEMTQEQSDKIDTWTKARYRDVQFKGM